MEKRIELAPISDSLVVERLRFENPWWHTGRISDHFAQHQQRAFFGGFLQEVQHNTLNRAVVLMGPRRVGKTVMMHHAIQRLIEAGVSPLQMVYLSIDSPMYLQHSLDSLFARARQLTGNKASAGWYVFFDEVQYLKNWEQHLKVLVDSYPQTKFVVSGSAAAALRFKSMESGAGRFTDVYLPPLSFYEYIQLKGLDQLLRPSGMPASANIKQFYSTIDIRRLNQHFVDYINHGGFPELLFSDKMRNSPERYIKGDILDKVLLRDLPGLYGIQNVQALNAFFTTLAYYSGNEVSLDSLSKSSGVDKNQLKKYLEYLEAAFLIKVVHRIDQSAKRFQRATFYKIYLTNPSLRCALYGPLEPTNDMMGNMVETAIFAQWVPTLSDMPWYARWTAGRTQGEVDLIGLHRHNQKPAWATEIKWSNRFFEKPADLKSLLSFGEENKLNSALITSIDKEGIKQHKGMLLQFIPAALYTYALGASMLSAAS
ncbi:MAG: ATP-binding protein [Bacteroidia bacterium]